LHSSSLIDIISLVMKIYPVAINIENNIVNDIQDMGGIEFNR
jgi:hypothetical protein